MIMPKMVLILLSMIATITCHALKYQEVPLDDMGTEESMETETPGIETRINTYLTSCNIKSYDQLNDLGIITSFLKCAAENGDEEVIEKTLSDENIYKILNQNQQDKEKCAYRVFDKFVIWVSNKKFVKVEERMTCARLGLVIATCLNIESLSNKILVDHVARSLCSHYQTEAYKEYNIMLKPLQYVIKHNNISFFKHLIDKYTEWGVLKKSEIQAIFHHVIENNNENMLAALIENSNCRSFIDPSITQALLDAINSGKFKNLNINTNVLVSRYLTPKNDQDCCIIL